MNVNQLVVVKTEAFVMKTHSSVNAHLGGLATSAPTDASQVDMVSTAPTPVNVSMEQTAITLQVSKLELFRFPLRLILIPCKSNTPLKSPSTLNPVGLKVVGVKIDLRKINLSYLEHIQNWRDTDKISMEPCARLEA